MTRRAWRATALVILAGGGIALRWHFIDFQSGDYRTFLSRWYAFIETHGHLAALADDSFSNYNTPYLVILALASYLPIQPIVAVKAISILGDLALAGVGAAIVARLRPQSFRTPVAAFGAVFLLPTVVMNSGVWGQCDSLYAACCLAAVLALIDRRVLAVVVEPLGPADVGERRRRDDHAGQSGWGDARRVRFCGKDAGHAATVRCGRAGGQR